MHIFTLIAVSPLLVGSTMAIAWPMPLLTGYQMDNYNQMFVAAGNKHSANNHSNAGKTVVETKNAGNATQVADIESQSIEIGIDNQQVGGFDQTEAEAQGESENEGERERENSVIADDPVSMPEATVSEINEPPADLLLENEPELMADTVHESPVVDTLPLDLIEQSLADSGTLPNATASVGTFKVSDELLQNFAIVNVNKDTEAQPEAYSEEPSSISSSINMDDASPSTPIGDNTWFTPTTTEIRNTTASAATLWSTLTNNTDGTTTLYRADNVSHTVEPLRDSRNSSWLPALPTSTKNNRTASSTRISRVSVKPTTAPRLTALNYTTNTSSIHSFTKHAGYDGETNGRYDGEHIEDMNESDGYAISPQSDMAGIAMLLVAMLLI